MAMTTCLFCGALIPISKGMQAGELVPCFECRVQFEVVSPDPILLKWPEDPLEVTKLSGQPGFG